MSVVRFVQPAVLARFILGHMMSLIYINNIIFSLTRAMLLLLWSKSYADDTSFMEETGNFKTIRENMKETIESVSEWFGANHVVLNLTNNIVYI